MRPSSERLAAAAGLAFVVFLVAGSLLFDLPGHDDSDEATVAFYAEGSNRARVVAGAYLFGAAGLSFLWFAYHLHGRLQIVEAGPHGVADLVFGAAVAFVVLLFLAGAMQGPTYAASIDAYDEPPAELSRMVPHQAYATLAYGFLAAALSIAAMSSAILRTQIFPRWLAKGGLVVSAVLLLGLLFVPIFLSLLALLAWVLAVSFVLFRGNAGPRTGVME